MDSEKLGACDEGGPHKFRTPKSAGCCDYFLCFFCWPCYAICSCMASEGAAFANPLFEQTCGGGGNKSDDHEPVCKKCGLTQAEAADLSAVRRSEGGTGYFSNAMQMPSASGAGPRESMPPQPVLDAQARY